MLKIHIKKFVNVPISINITSAIQGRTTMRMKISMLLGLAILAGCGGSDGTYPVTQGAKLAYSQACINCHAKSNEAPKFDIGGTLYPTGHEDNDCNADAPSIAGATIVITDNNGVATTLTPDNVGNFSYTSGGRNGNPVIALPYTAKVVQNGKTRAMGAAQMSGDCNDCHTPTGRNGAPGRVTIPIP